MHSTIAFSDALEAAEQLDADAQVELVAILRRRLAERGREHVAASVAESRREYAAGECAVMTAGKIVREAYYCRLFHESGWRRWCLTARTRTVSASTRK